MGRWGRLVLAGLIAGSAFGVRAEDAGTGSASACRFEIVSAGTVATVLDGQNFVLDDGRQVRLAALEVPPLPVPGDAGTPTTLGVAAKAALAAILSGANVDLRQQRASADRYGRLVAHAFVAHAGGERSVAQALLAQGHARVTAHVGHRACAAELLSQERVARAAGLGLWADSAYGIIAAGNGSILLAGQGRFVVAEGRVVSVRESGGTIYMNFGRRWSEALTVTISKRHERMFVGAGLQLKSLENRRVRVRGWVEERNGPRIEASHPEQIEIAELTASRMP
jgi:endonuclease YncB( thermonuclease family)